MKRREDRREKMREEERRRAKAVMMEILEGTGCSKDADTVVLR